MFFLAFDDMLKLLKLLDYPLYNQHGDKWEFLFHSIVIIASSINA
jgi:hypothetical protein